MSAQRKHSKEQKQFLVSKAVLEIIDKKGLASITHSNVARTSGVSRAWIYEYIGKDRNAVLDYAANIMASYFSRSTLPFPNNKEQLEHQFTDATTFLLNNAETDPVLIRLYFRYRGTETSLGNAIEKYERDWLSGIKTSLKSIYNISEKRAQNASQILLAIRMAIAHRYATSKNIQETRENAEDIFEVVHRYVSELE